MELVDGRIARRFKFDEAELEKPQVPDQVSRLLRSITEEWGDANINVLLNHVYFNTEPMEHAKRGEILDFFDAPAVHANRTEIGPCEIGRSQGSARSGC